jgi:hypothetical protein
MIESDKSSESETFVSSFLDKTPPPRLTGLSTPAANEWVSLTRVIPGILYNDR